jgi:hypothetical protein
MIQSPASDYATPQQLLAFGSYRGAVDITFNFPDAALYLLEPFGCAFNGRLERRVSDRVAPLFKLPMNRYMQIR